MKPATGKRIQIRCMDGYLLDSTVFEPEADNVKAVVIICNALGVEQQFYHKFAQYLCDRHFNVITFDYRGMGGSRRVSFQGPLVLADWGRQDIDAVIRHAATLPGAQNMPAGLITIWAKWARDPDYVTAEKFGLDTRLFETLAIPILTLGFDDDTYAPRKSIQRLQSALKSADIQDRYIRAKDLYPNGIGHFGFFRALGRKDLWPDALDWLLAHILPTR